MNWRTTRSLLPLRALLDVDAPVLAAVVLVLALAVAGSAVAHPTDMAGDSLLTPSAALKSAERNRPLGVLAGDFVVDPVDPGGDMDIASLRITGADQLTFEVTLRGEAAPEPETLSIQIVLPGEAAPVLSVVELEYRGWAVYRLDRGTMAYEPVGPARIEREGGQVRIEVSRADLPPGELLVFAQTLGVSDAFEPLLDVAPDDRQGLQLPAIGDGTASSR
jgi:hypothetical protein